MSTNNWLRDFLHQRLKPEPTATPTKPVLVVHVATELKQGTCSWWKHSQHRHKAVNYISFRAGPYRAELVETDAGKWVLESFLMQPPEYRIEYASIHEAVTAWRETVRRDVLQYARITHMRDDA